MQTSVLFGAKNFGFFEIYGVSPRTRGRRGLSQSDKGEGSFFRDFVRTSFMDGPLQYAWKSNYCSNCFVFQ